MINKYERGFYILIQGNYINGNDYFTISNWLNWRNKNFNKKYPEVLKNITIKVN